MSDQRQTANLLGALALSLTDRMRVTVENATGFGGEAAAALVTIGAEPDSAIRFVAAVVGLSHSGTVRLIDKLESEGLVTRQSGTDGRTAALRLTGVGQKRVEAILDARESALNDAVSGLSNIQMEGLSRLLGPLLHGQVIEAEDEHRVCRLCDTSVCYPAGCPLHRDEPAE